LYFVISIRLQFLNFVITQYTIVCFVHHCTSVHCPPLYTVHQCTLSTTVHSPSMYTDGECTLSISVHWPSVYTDGELWYTVHQCTVTISVHCTPLYTVHQCTLSTSVQCASVYTVLHCTLFNVFTLHNHGRCFEWSVWTSTSRVVGYNVWMSCCLFPTRRLFAVSFGYRGQHAVESR